MKPPDVYDCEYCNPHEIWFCEHAGGTHVCPFDHHVDHRACTPQRMGKIVGTLSDDRALDETGRVWALRETPSGLSWVFVRASFPGVIR